LVFDRLVGVGRRWQHAAAAGRYVLVEAAAPGWWYSAPLPGGGLITMLMTDADLSRRSRLRDTSAWLDALNGATATSARTAGARRTGAPSVQAATSVRTVRRRDRLPWLAVGDAALAVDPITGSGVVRALRTAAAAALTVEQLLDAAPAAHPAIITAYEHARDLECDEYLHTRRGYYAAVGDRDTDFWRRRNRPPGQ
jgi:2-polyprenyl-6-methoxyphenol hydroxylase-like FAD-dependent oxidoreductase